jgi:hypothetical protein
MFESGRVQQLPTLRAPSPHDPYAFYWKEGSLDNPSGRWTFECDLFRHDGQEKYFDLPYFLPLKAGVQKKGIRIEVFARNLSRSISANVPVVISSTQADTVEVAMKMLDQQLPPQPEVTISFSL